MLDRLAALVGFLVCLTLLDACRERPTTSHPIHKCELPDMTPKETNYSLSAKSIYKINEEGLFLDCPNITLPDDDLYRKYQVLILGIRNGTQPPYTFSHAQEYYSRNGSPDYECNNHTFFSSLYGGNDTILLATGFYCHYFNFSEQAIARAELKYVYNLTLIT